MAHEAPPLADALLVVHGCQENGNHFFLRGYCDWDIAQDLVDCPTPMCMPSAPTGFSGNYRDREKKGYESW